MSSNIKLTKVFEANSAKQLEDKINKLRLAFGTEYKVKIMSANRKWYAWAELTQPEYEHLVRFEESKDGSK